jgi:signal transduction histidine kinase
MPGIPHNRFHSTIRAPAADALDSLAEHTEDILAAWHYGIRPLGLNPSTFLSASSVDFSMLAADLRRSRYAVFRRRMKEFGKALAQQASLGQAVVAFNELFGICIRVLLEDETRKASLVLALSRLYALAGLVVVSGYTGEWGSSRETLVEASVLEAEDEARSASAYVMRIYEQELHRIAQELHDDVAPDLVRIQQYLEMIGLAAQGKDLPEFQPRLAEAMALVSCSIESVRRIGLDLGQAIFEDLGLLSAVRAFAHQFSARTKINVFLCEGHIPDTIPMIHQVTLYRLMQEALANVLDGASARNVTVSVGSVKDSVLVMVVEDDGADLNTKNRRARRPFGLRIMRERAESLGGRIHVESRRESPMSPDGGTRIQIDLPLPGRPLGLSSAALSGA